MVKRYGDDAMLEAAVRADKLLDARGNLNGAQTSHGGVYSRDIWVAAVNHRSTQPNVFLAFSKLVKKLVLVPALPILLRRRP